MSALLSRLCDPSGLQFVKHEPFHVNVDDAMFLVATSGAAIAAVVDDGSDTSQIDQKVRDKVAIYLRLAAETPVDIQRLIEFCGSPDWTADCKQCNGTGAVTCETCHGSQRTTHYCDVCDHAHACGCPDCDDGTMHCSCKRYISPRDVLIRDTPFDARLIARALAAAGASGWAMMGVDDGTLVVRGDGWRIVVKALARACASAPEFS